MRGPAAVLLMVAGGVLGSTAPAAAQQGPDGAQVFELVCAMCHSVNPPAKAAPPISHAAAYYLRKHGTAAAAATAMVLFGGERGAGPSPMPAHAIERWGLMPPQGHLSEAHLQAVARYVITLADTVHVRGTGQGGHGNHGGGGGGGR
jgi:cytochrome c